MARGHDIIVIDLSKKRMHARACITVHVAGDIPCIVPGAVVHGIGMNGACNEAGLGQLPCGCVLKAIGLHILPLLILFLAGWLALCRTYVHVCSHMMRAKALHLSPLCKQAR